MLQCSDIDARIIDWLYDGLDEGETERFRAHLRGCGRCREEVGALERARAAARALPEIEPPASATAILLHQAAECARAGRRRVTSEDKRLGVAAWIAERMQMLLAHPAMSAAAALLVVAGVAGALYVRGLGGVSEPTRTSPASPPAGGAAAAPAGMASAEPPPATASRPAAAPSAVATGGQAAAGGGAVTKNATGPVRLAFHGRLASAQTRRALARKRAEAQRRATATKKRTLAAKRSHRGAHATARSPHHRHHSTNRARLRVRPGASSQAVGIDGLLAGGNVASGATAERSAPKTSATALRQESRFAAAPPAARGGGGGRAAAAPRPAASAAGSPSQPSVAHNRRGSARPDAAALAWAKAEARKLAKAARAKRCHQAARIANDILDRVPAFYAQRVRGSAAVKRCAAEVRSERRHRLAARARAHKAARARAKKQAAAQAPASK